MRIKYNSLTLAQDLQELTYGCFGEFIQTFKIMISSTTDVDLLLSEIKTHFKNYKKGLILLIGEENPIDRQLLVQALNESEIKFVGGSIPGVIQNDVYNFDKILVKQVDFIEEPILLNEHSNLSKNLLQKFNNDQSKDTTILIVFEGMGNEVSDYLLHIYDHQPVNADALGFGVGSLKYPDRPSLLVKEGLKKNCCVVAQLDTKSIFEKKHGWRDAQGPCIATRTNQNIVHEINWQPAKTFYFNFLKKQVSDQITQDNFYNYAMQYPFGMYKEGNEKIVRDALSFCEDGSLLFNSEIIENSVLHIQVAQPKDLLNAVSSIANNYIEKAKQYTCNDVLLINCVSRQLFLDEQFTEELSVIHEVLHKENLNVEGFLSMGEIGATRNTYIDILNKTVVLSSFSNNGKS